MRVTFLVLFLAGCGTNTSVDVCPQIDASACQEPSPSFANDITPLFAASCNGTCHSGEAGAWPLVDHGDVSDWQTLIASDMENCSMPVPVAHGGAPLTVKQRAMVLDWIACGARDN